MADATLTAANQLAALDDAVAIAAAQAQKADAVAAATQNLADLQAQPLDAFADAGPDAGGFFAGVGAWLADAWNNVTEAWNTVTGWVSEAWGVVSTRIGETLDEIQLALDLAGMAPVVGNIADAANTIISLLRGNWADAGLNALAMIPGLGQGVTGAKLAAAGVPLVVKYSDEAAAVLKHADEAAGVLKHSDTAADAAKHAARRVISRIGDLSQAERKALQNIWDGGPRSQLPLQIREQLAELYSGVAKRNPAGSAQAAFNQARADYLLGRGPNPGRSVNEFAERFGFPKFKRGE